MESTTAAWATVVIALFTVALFILQFWQHRHDKNVARANYKLALFDKRMEIYLALEDMFSDFLTHGRPDMEAIVKMRHEARHAHFLFPDKVLVFVNEIVKKGVEHRKAYAAWEPLRARAYAGERLSEDEQNKKTQSLGKMHEIENWFIDQCTSERLKNELGPHLKLPEGV